MNNMKTSEIDLLCGGLCLLYCFGWYLLLKSIM